jgi:hypothetical protein
MSNQKAVQRTELEQIQEDAKTPSITVEARRDSVDAGQLHGELGEMADSFDMTGFKCAHEECGLVHNHDSTKHRYSDSSDASEAEAAQMEANPNCHCGLNEAARRGDADVSPSRANSMAPIPDSMSRHIDSSL